MGLPVESPMLYVNANSIIYEETVQKIQNSTAAKDCLHFSILDPKSKIL